MDSEQGANTTGAVPQAARFAIYFILSQVVLVTLDFGKGLMPDAERMFNFVYVVFVSVFFSDPILEARYFASEVKLITRAHRRRLLMIWGVGILLCLTSSVLVLLLSHRAGFFLVAALTPFLIKPHFQLWWPVERGDR